nr:DUF6362 family protein [Granulicella paludicola]
MKPSDKLTMVSIADRLEEAAYTLRRLPKVTVQGFKSNWPATINEFHESYGYNDATVRMGPPSARHITEMDEALLWLTILRPILITSGSSFGCAPIAFAGSALNSVSAIAGQSCITTTAMP